MQLLLKSRIHIPDLIMVKDNKKFLAFIITKEYDLKKCCDYIELHKEFLEYKIFYVNGNNLFELKKNCDLKTAQTLCWDCFLLVSFFILYSKCTS